MRDFLSGAYILVRRHEVPAGEHKYKRPIARGGVDFLALERVPDPRAVGILERGTWWGSFEGHRRLPETIPRLLAALAALNLSGFGRSLSIPLFRSGLLEFSLHGGTIVVNSSAVGGNSLVSGAYMHRPAPQFYDALPPELTEAELAPHYERIERALQVSNGRRIKANLPS